MLVEPFSAKKLIILRLQVEDKIDSKSTLNLSHEGFLFSHSCLIKCRVERKVTSMER